MKVAFKHKLFAHPIFQSGMNTSEMPLIDWTKKRLWLIAPKLFCKYLECICIDIQCSICIVSIVLLMDVVLYFQPCYYYFYWVVPMWWEIYSTLPMLQIMWNSLKNPPRIYQPVTFQRWSHIPLASHQV